MFKKITCLSVLALQSFFMIAQEEKEIKVTTDIKSAIIYLDGAEIHRTKKVQLEKGRTKVVFTGLSPKFNSQNIQVTTTNDVELLAISHRIDYLTNVKEKPRVEELKDSLDMLNQKNIALNNEKEAYNIEKDMLMQNKSIGGSNNGVSVVELKQAADLYRNRLMEINKAISNVDRGINDNNKKISRINIELIQANAKTAYSRGEITLLLDVETSVTTEIDLKYLVTNAGWTPSYNIRAEDINKPIKLEYKAYVYNNTDIDWQNINFKLSTSDPTLSATQPKMTPWYLNYNNQYDNYQYKKQTSNMYQVRGSRSASEQQYIDGVLNNEGFTQNAYFNGKANTVANIPSTDFENISVSELSAEFDIEKSYTIPSDNKPYIVDVTNHELQTLYKHYAVPKLEKDAFLLARIINWQDLNLIEGTANIYFAGTYVGQSFIATRNVSDTLDISLGRDNKVMVTRTKMKDFSSIKYIGSNRKETHAYQMVVKNNRKVPINIEVLDQIPVSQDSEIEVFSEEISNANKNDLTGELKWNFNIEPNQNETINLTFSVKYPKNKPVTIGKSNYKSRRVRTKF
ncbi:MAG: DUF4139 domain-containing protein [Flavobacteriales bacterium]|nr:DUF4139 domain-containing protein [Flavobacteriales bacterium]